MKRPMRQRSRCGFTLLEVLVALAVLSLALFAVVMAAAQRADTLHELQRRQYALEVADSVLNTYLRQGSVSDGSGVLSGSQINGAVRWYWRIRRQATDNPRIFRITAEVADSPTFDHLGARLTGFSSL